MPRGGGGGRGGGGYGRGGGGKGAGGFGGDINAMLDPLDEEMLFAFENMRQTVNDTWSQFAGNEGQMTIVRNYIHPVSQEFIVYAKEEWPYTGEPDEYLEFIYNAYDPEVIERAFGDTVHDLYEHIGGLWSGAMNAQDAHNEIMGGIVVVHSTNPPWIA